MDKQFWLEKWQTNEIGFHQDEVNSYLENWWGSLQIKSGDSVFVPLCGKSRDMLWLLGQGYKVIGIEISLQAVELFFAENELQSVRSDHEKFTRFDANELTIFCGDFFDLTASDLQTITAIYDRAALIALPPEMRQQYTNHLLAILPDKTETLLITMEYPQEEMNGPPFSVNEKEVHNLHANKCQIEMLSEHNVLDESPRFKERGLTSMIEKVYRLSR